jgi:HEAT repeat protein
MSRAQSIRRAGGPRRRVGLLVVIAAALPAVVAAQVPGDPDNPRSRLRDRYKAPQNTAKLDESVRKLNGDDPTERLEAVTALGQVNDPKAVEHLVAAASDPDMRIRVKAIDTLGNIKATEATSLLIQQLFLRDTDVATKRRILASLGKIGDRNATGPILDFLSRNVDPAARGNAIFALGDIGDPRAVKPLETLAQKTTDDNLRSLAQETIRKIQTRPEPAVVPPALAVDRRGPGNAGTP